jgi:hypothetical protein
MGELLTDRGEAGVKILFSALFIFMGCLFLLISTVFYPAITGYLLDLQGTIATPSFWDLQFVLGFVKIIFIIVGIFLTIFGIGSIFIKKP